NQARCMYRRWDEMISRSTPSEWLIVALIGIGLVTGPWGYLVAAGGVFALAIVNRRAPKKYHCDACGHAFFKAGISRPRATPSSTAHASPGQ
ncbi:MAG: hypothetical protein OES09_13085, partial [Gammaproteobacteria bacterium]|nr:hypothetical protein [Gammaproteobacteria bacterium]